MDEQWFTKAMYVLATTFDIEITKERIRSYWESLKHRDQETMGHAMKDCRDKCQFFPQVADIVEAYNQNYEIKMRYEKLERQEIVKLPWHPPEKTTLAQDSLAFIKDILARYGRVNGYKLPAAEVYKRCLELDKKYPDIGFKESANYYNSQISIEEARSVQNLSPDIPIHGDKFKVDSRGILDANKGKVDFKDLWDC